ncbi:MAG TPA: hypothetical protein VNN09_06500 [Candidatus Competibacteraceae bacterium]|nr:hypothetical protein [Candidatus Competibacteraceae bacterium]
MDSSIKVVLTAVGAGAVAGRAILWLGRVVLANPIGLTLTAIAGAAYLIWRNWEVIGPKLAAVWETVKGAFASLWLPTRATPHEHCHLHHAARLMLLALLAATRPHAEQQRPAQGTQHPGE